MNLASGRSMAGGASRAALVAVLVLAGAAPAMAQNKKNSWEVFIYFGGYFSNQVPSAKQFGDVTTYRLDPQNFTLGDVYNPADVITRGLGKVGGDQSGDHTTYPFQVSPPSQFNSAPCSGSLQPLDPNGDPRAAYFDECDNDQESRWLYNAGGITTNGEIQTDDSEFTLGLRAGYNITRHWEVEVDIGFGKQRLDLTKNLDPLLTVQVNNLTDPRAKALAKFYQFTWANVDLETLYPENGLDGEHPHVIASRRANDPNYTIPIYYPYNAIDSTIYPAETFADVTGFVNRVFQDPTAFRNRANQINIDQFTLSGSVIYNFNTKADSRIVPYVSAGFGRWIRNFDSPWDGTDTNFLNYGGGVRFFVNEIFSFRAEARSVHYLDDSFTINGSLHQFNLQDRAWSSFGGCVRDNQDRRPPCSPQFVPPSNVFPNLGGGGGNATIEVEAELDDFFEIRVGFDVILGGK